MCMRPQLTVTSAVFAKLMTTIDHVLYAPYPCLNRWVTVSATLKVLIQAGKRVHLALQEVLVQGFDMFSGLTLEDAFLDKVRDTTAAAAAKTAATSNSSTLPLQTSTTFVQPYMCSLKLYPAAAMGEVPSKTAPAIVIARGLEINTDFTVKHTNRQVSALCGVLVLDALMLLLATGLFLRPLEKMGARIKAGASIDISHLQQLSSRRRWSFTIAAAGTASLALGALMGTWGIQNLKAAIANRSAAEPGILQLSYRRYIIVVAARFIALFPLPHAHTSSVRATLYTSSVAVVYTEL
eukprot:5247-Heterococcus_DN1.PRE.2